VRRKQVVISPLSDRVAEYYTTPLGAAPQHASGWPLQTLANLARRIVLRVARSLRRGGDRDDVLARARLDLPR
jgi:hypothetical protein